MELKELLKIAGEKPEVRDAVVKLASVLYKKAQSNAVTKFDETVPVLAQPTQQKVSGSGISGTAQTAQESVPGMVDQAPPASVVPPAGVMGPGPGMMPPGAGAVPPGAEVGAVPGQEAPTGPTNPAQEGVIAAQEFLGPIMEAAMNGDPNAQMIIAQAAGNIARGIAEAAHSAMQGGAAPQPGAEGGMVPPASPEEAVANQIVPPQAALPPAPGGAPTPGAAPVPAAGGPPPDEKKENPFAKKDESAKSDAGTSQPPIKEVSGKDSKPKDEKPGGTKTGEDDKEFKKMSMDVSVMRELLDLARAGKI